jgi:hypothetical protein
MSDFKEIFKSEKAREMGFKLKEIIESHFHAIEGNIVGGAKVKLILYSRSEANNVLCGIQEGANDSCMLYVHHMQELNHKRLKFSGKGKHAKRIKFTSLNEIIEKDIRWLLSEVDKNAPH